MTPFFIFRFGEYMDVSGPYADWEEAHAEFFLQVMAFPEHTFFLMDPMTEGPWIKIRLDTNKETT